jgi:DNA polymerase-3 subunit delta
MDLPPGEAGETLDRILDAIRKNRVAPCYLLYGDEEYLVRSALDQIISCLLPPADRDLNLFYMDGGQEDIDRLCESLMTVPLIPGRKVVVVRNTRIFHSKKTLPELVRKIGNRAKHDPAGAAGDFMTFLRIVGWRLDDLKGDGWKKISDDAWRRAVDGDDGVGREAWLPVMVEYGIRRGVEGGHGGDDRDRLSDTLSAGLPEGNCLILTADAVDKRKRIYRTLAEKGRILQFSEIKGEARLKNVLMRTARDILAAKGKTLDSEAWLALGRKTGFSLRASMAALEKLVTFVGGTKRITTEDVDAVIGKTREETAFHLTAALLKKDLAKSLATLKDLLDQGDPPLMILAILAREIRLLLHARLLLDSGPPAAYRPGMDYGRFQKSVYPDIQRMPGPKLPHPYVLYQALTHAPRFTERRLAELLDSLVDMDLAMKTSSKDARLMLERFLLRVCSSQAPD